MMVTAALTAIRIYKFSIANEVESECGIGRNSLLVGAYVHGMQLEVRGQHRSLN